METIVIAENDGGQRLDRFLKKYLKNASLSNIYRMIRKDVKLNGKRGHVNTILNAGDALTIYVGRSELDRFHAVQPALTAKKQFKIIFEDDNILVVDKPFGLLVHGDGQEKQRTLVNQVRGYLESTGEHDQKKEKVFRLAPANRLDRNTTGIVVFGKNAAATRALAKGFREKGKLQKYYLSIVKGEIKQKLLLKGIITKDESKNIVRISDAGSNYIRNANDKAALSRGGFSKKQKKIETVVVPRKCKKGFTFVEIQIMTGRTHQIRAHLAHAGYPLIGDAKYGDRDFNLQMKECYGLTTQLLHANRLAFVNMSPPLGYLDGMEIKANPSRSFQNIKKDIFG